MHRRFPFALLLFAIVLGCSRKPSEPPGDDAKAFAITIRNRAAGDKFAVVETGGGTRTIIEDFGDNSPKTHTSGGEHRYEFTEELLEVPTPGELPTKIRRAYTVAQQTDLGKTEAAPFQGKSVLIQSENDGYAYRLEPGGELLFGPHAQHMARQYNPIAKAMKPTALLPDGPVKLGEPWPLNKEHVGKMFVPPGARFDVGKTTAFGKLVRTMKRDGHECGEIVFELSFALLDDGPPNALLRIVPGSVLNVSFTVEQSIDGGSSDADVRVLFVEETRLRAERKPMEAPDPKLPNEVRIRMEARETITTKWLK